MAGENTLTFVIYNEESGTGHATPTGLRVEGTIVPAGGHDGSLSGSVYADANNDARQEAGEPGLGGVAVTLTGTLDSGGTVAATTATLDDGSYRFEHLAPGTYAIAETCPAGL